jgi:hypothetical protein
MNMISKLGAALLLGAGSIVVSACAATLPAQVTRFQAMPAPAGQSFYVVPASGQPAGLEFGQYASIVSQQLAARGYRPAGAPQLADMLVRLDYGVDQGSQEYRADPFARSRYRSPFYDPFWGVHYGRPYYPRYGSYRSAYYWGWDDPFWYDGYGSRGRDRVYTVYKSHLDLNIVRRADNAPLFEGHARARSQTDQLGVLVPNLVEAMFTGFPGRSGETVKITVPAKRS